MPAGERRAAILDAALSVFAERGYHAALIAAEPAAAREGEADPEQAIAMLAEQLVGAVQALANWWADHQEVPREVLVDRVMDFAWIGLERLRAGERSSR